MATCKDVAAFLDQIRARSVTGTLPPADLSALAQAGLVRVVSADQYAQMTRDVGTIDAGRTAIGQEVAGRRAAAQRVAAEEAHAHSILFHFEGSERRQSEDAQRTADEATLRATDADLAQREQQFNALLAQQSMLDTLTPYAGQYVGLTGFGAVQARDLGVRMYRVSDLDFAAYWSAAQGIDRQLNDIGEHGAGYLAQLAPRLPNSDRSYLWAIAVGLAKSQPDLAAGSTTFLSAYSAIGAFAHNDENRLLAAELVSAIPRPLDSTVAALREFEPAVRKAGVPKESALGVAALMVLGQRADGSNALPQLGQFLKLTRSYETAALLAIVNRPYDDLATKFAALRSLFASWGFQLSEDEELASAYLTLSDLPANGIATKLTILTRGLAQYLQYPLVAAAILAAIPVYEANETLNLLERAYEIIGRRAMPLSQAELICLAVRMIQGVRDETVSGLDATAAATRAPAGGGYPMGRGFLFVPIIVLHGSYYSTFGGFGGAHPGHVHAFAGGVG